jgi:hypothetical protein
LAGFRPLGNNIKDKWRKFISENYSKFRLDLFCLGLMWLEFSGIDLTFIHSEINAEYLIKEILNYRNLITNSTIVNKLLDLK